jgi:hypothetical protein
MRDVKVYEPEERRYVVNNLYCFYCGNTHQWQIDLKLKHVVECSTEGLIVGIEEQRTRKIFHSIERKICWLLEKSKPLFRCANCGNMGLELQEWMLDSCYNLECPGCFHCQNWMDKEMLIELCSDCIHKKKGIITDDDCRTICDYHPDGLGEVRDHYDVSLENLKYELGYY